MLTYVVAFSALLAIAVLATVHLSDRWEHEPVEVIQGLFVSGLLLQLGLVVGARVLGAAEDWSGPWMLLTLLAAALALPALALAQREFDEPYDAVVYAGAYFAGGGAVVHIWNLPASLVDSPYRSVLRAEAVPDARDLLLLLSSPDPIRGLVEWLFLLGCGVAIGGVLGRMWTSGPGMLRRTGACAAAALALWGGDVAFGGAVAWRLGLLVVAGGHALILKRGSPHREKPERLEADLVAKAVKTTFLVLGAVFFAMVVLVYVGGPRFEFLSAVPADLPSLVPPGGAR